MGKPSIYLVSVSALGLATVGGCGQPVGTTEPASAQASARSGAPAAQLPTGDLAGAAWTNIGAQVPNPYENQPAAIAEGQRLFVEMNCAGCHGYTLKGAMGPDLTDRYWRYGGSPGAIYQSIANGRPQGMPAWRDALTPAEIWKLVSYIESYGGAVPAAQFQAGLQGDLPPNPRNQHGPGLDESNQGGQSGGSNTSPRQASK